MTKADDRTTLLRIERELRALRVDVREDGRWVKRCALCGAGESEPHQRGQFCARIADALAASSTITDVARLVTQALGERDDGEP